jgi:hypothetical protein
LLFSVFMVGLRERGWLAVRGSGSGVLPVCV